jgi:hypothetical protein
MRGVGAKQEQEAAPGGRLDLIRLKQGVGLLPRLGTDTRRILHDAAVMQYPGQR